MESCPFALGITGEQLQTAVTVWLPQIITVASLILVWAPRPDPNTRLGKLYRVLQIAAMAVGNARQHGMLKPAPPSAAAAEEFLRSLQQEQKR